MNNDILKFWEPNAPSFEERFQSLIYAFENGYNTGISMEPFLDNKVEDTVATLKDFVTDTIWIGKIKRLRLDLSLNDYKTDPVVQQKASELIDLYDSNYKFELYEKFKNDSIIRWKDSLKKDLGLTRLTKKGLNI